jgi:hypothetical protein
MQDRKVVRNQQKQKKITSILEAWLHYIQLEDMAQAEVSGKDINDEEEITLSGDCLFMSQSAYDKLQDKKAKEKNPDEFVLALSFPQIYYIEKGERKFTPMFGLIITEILSEGYKLEGWDLSKCEFQPVTKNLEHLFFMDENDIEQLVTGEGIHLFLKLTFGFIQATLSEICNEIQLPVEQINKFKICYRPYLFKFENTNFNFNLKRDIKEIKKKGQSWAIPGHPAYEYLFGKPQPYKLETLFLGAFPIEFPPTDSQAEVLKHAKDNPMTAVQGPPGSGKTTLIGVKTRYAQN